ncbi:MAG: DUF2339 domain-containing protein, partial [Lysinibacillus sp.]
YLLEYMDFNQLYILLFIVVLFGCVQLVIIKHQQKVALLIAFFFSNIALLSLWAFEREFHILFASALVIILLKFVYSWWRLYSVATKYKVLYESLLFSASVMSFMIVSIVGNTFAEWALLLVTLLFLGVSFFAYKKDQRRVFDLFGTIGFLAFLNALLMMNILEEFAVILYPLTTFMGLLLAIRLRASLMKVTYSMIFAVQVLISYTFYGVEPFWSTGHLNQLLILAYMIICFVYAKKEKEQPTQFELVVTKLQFNHIVPLVIALLFFLYLYKLDWAYVSIAMWHPYMTHTILAIVTISSLLLSQQVVGRYFSKTLLVVFALTTFSLLDVHRHIDGEGLFDIAIRVLFALIWLALIADLFKQGLIYKKWAKDVQKYVDILIVVGLLMAMILLIFTFEQLAFNTLLSDKIAVSAQSVLLFGTAATALWLSAIKKFNTLRIMGYTLLVIAIFKLVFFDLSTLDLLIRAILFMSIGAVGLFLTSFNRKHPPQ